MALLLRGAHSTQWPGSAPSSLACRALCTVNMAQARRARSDPCKAVQFAKEGEELSKKQLALESSAKKLRAQQKESDLASKDLETKLLMEQQKVSPRAP